MCVRPRRAQKHTQTRKYVSVHVEQFGTGSVMVKTVLHTFLYAKESSIRSGDVIWLV